LSGADATTGDEDPIEVPWVQLTPSALRGVIENYVLREGTDYGESERSLDQKVADVTRQLERKEARILFDPASESVTLVRA
jgi:uncharacterized protein